MRRDCRGLKWSESSLSVPRALQLNFEKRKAKHQQQKPELMSAPNGRSLLNNLLISTMKNKKISILTKRKLIISEIFHTAPAANRKHISSGSLAEREKKWQMGNNLSSVEICEGMKYEIVVDVKRISRFLLLLPRPLQYFHHHLQQLQ